MIDHFITRCRLRCRRARADKANGIAIDDQSLLCLGAIAETSEQFSAFDMPHHE
jgi:hypothetical protein